MSEILEKLLNSELENKDFEDAVEYLTRTHQGIMSEIYEKDKEISPSEATVIARKKELIHKDIAKYVIKLWKRYTEFKILEEKGYNTTNQRSLFEEFGNRYVSNRGNIKTYLKALRNIYKKMGY